MRVRRPPRVAQSDLMIPPRVQSSLPSPPGPHLLSEGEPGAQEAQAQMDM